MPSSVLPTQFRRTVRGVALAVSLACHGAVAAAEATPAVFYASPRGNDAWSGRLAAPAAAGTDGPFATLTRARAAARQAGPGTVVELRGGRYCLDETFVLGPEDAGTAAQPTTYRAYPGERPVLCGARPITGFAAWQGEVLRADLTTQGLKGRRIGQLFLNGQRLTPARWPNLDPAEPCTSGWAYVDDEPIRPVPNAPGGLKRTFRTRPQDLRPWANPTDGEVFIFPQHEWWNNVVPIAAVDPAARLVTLAADCSYEITPKSRYFIHGLQEELDAPGEWVHDPRRDTLTVWPPAGSAALDGQVYAAVVRDLIRIEKASSVVLQGLTFEYADGSAVVVRSSQDCRVAACTIRNTGDYRGSGVVIEGGRGNGVIGCDIHDTGSHGISLSGGDQKTLTPAGNVAENNAIWRTGVIYKQGCGIAVSGVGNRVSHNELSFLPRFGVMFGGNRHVIELNHIHDVSLETTDTGAIYGGSLDWRSGHGVVIRHNRIERVVGRGRRHDEWASPFFAWGIYLDWTAMGVTVQGNLVSNCPRGGIHLHDGRDNVVENNVIVDGATGRFDDGAQIELNGWTTATGYWTRGLEVFHWAEQYESVVHEPAWQGVTSLRDPRTAALPNGQTMHHNTIRRNIVCQTRTDPAPPLTWRTDAPAIRYRNADFAQNPSDLNLFWSGGAAIRTGQFRVKETVGENRVPNAGFEEGAAERPAGWRGRLPTPESVLRSVADGPRSGQRCLELQAVASPANAGKPEWERQAALQTAYLPARPGRSYRLSCWLRAPAERTPVRIEALSFKAGAYDVRFSSEVQVGPSWQEAEVSFRFPAPGDSNHHAGMETTFYVRVILRQDAGTLWLDDVDLREAVLSSEWEAWQALGMDPNSRVADPQFVDAAQGDFRLQPESPAWALGFEAIPVERIGCYADALRASWPLPRDAAGAAVQER